MPSACLLARTTMTAAFQRMKARMRRSMCSSPGNHACCSRGMVLTYGVRDRGRQPDLQLAGPLEQLGDEEPGPGLAVGVDDGVEAVEPLLRLVGIDVGELVDEPVEDHARTMLALAGRYRPHDGAPGTIAYTDGACLGNPGPGRLGVGRARTGRSPAAPRPHTTNQRMEITAALEAVRAHRRAGSRS